MRRSELPQHLRRRSFTTKSAVAAGMPHYRTYAKDLIRVSRGIILPAGVPLAGVAALTAYIEANPAHVLSHVTAARLWGIPLPYPVQEDWRVHLANLSSASWAPRRVNVVGHRLALAPGEILMLDGVRVTSPARTWLDLAACLSLSDLIAAGDHLICCHGADFPVPRTAICSIDDLATTMALHPGMRGMRNVRAALGLVRVGVDSPPETMMRLALIDAGLPEPELNLAVKDEYGQAVLWPDGAYRQYRFSLQYDGNHHNSPDQYQRDIRRLETTKRIGWEEIRISRDDVRGEHPDVVRKVAAALRSRGWKP